MAQPQAAPRTSWAITPEEGADRGRKRGNRTPQAARSSRIARRTNSRRRASSAATRFASLARPELLGGRGFLIELTPRGGRWLAIAASVSPYFAHFYKEYPRSTIDRRLAQHIAGYRWVSATIVSTGRDHAYSATHARPQSQTSLAWRQRRGRWARIDVRTFARLSQLERYAMRSCGASASCSLCWLAG
jgi:hypothetical protein